jgi:hypothetical protein
VCVQVPCVYLLHTASTVTVQNMTYYSILDIEMKLDRLKVNVYNVYFSK